MGRARRARHAAGGLRRSSRGLPADDPFWPLTIGDPGPDALFDGAVYQRGAMTLHALRLAVGDDAFFRILRKWAASKRGGNGTTAEFIELAERISGQDLDALFTTWLFTPAKPDVGRGRAALTAAAHERVRVRSVVAARRRRLMRAQPQGGAAPLGSHPSSRWGASVASQRLSAMPSATASPLPRLCVTPSEPWPVASTRPPTPG